MGWQGQEQGQKQDQGQRHGQGQGHGGGQRRGRWEGQRRGQGGRPHGNSDNKGGMSRDRSIPSTATDTAATGTTTSTSVYSNSHAPRQFPAADKILFNDPEDDQTGLPLPLPSISTSPTKLDITGQDESLIPTISETFTGKIRFLFFIRYRQFLI